MEYQGAIYVTFFTWCVAQNTTHTADNRRSCGLKKNPMADNLKERTTVSSCMCKSAERTLTISCCITRGHSTVGSHLLSTLILIGLRKTSRKGRKCLTHVVNALKNNLGSYLRNNYKEKCRERSHVNHQNTFSSFYNSILVFSQLQ